MTLLELLSIQNEPYLTQRILAATVIAAEVVRAENVNTANHANRLKWAKTVFEHPQLAGQAMLWAVLAQNNAYSVAQVLAADDATVKAAVLNAVDVFASS